MTAQRWWQKPRLRRDEEAHQERKVSWLELFYDLVFVVVIAELSHSLAGHISVSGVVGFILLFIPVWWVWIGGTFYNDRFETDDLGHRLFTFLQMLPVGALAVFAHDGLGETSTGFALSYAAARALITYLWLRGGLHDPVARPLTNRYGIGFSVSVLFVLCHLCIRPCTRALRLPGSRASVRFAHASYDTEHSAPTAAPYDLASARALRAVCHYRAR